MATGYALGRGAPAFALLHTTAGLGNAVAALATARVNRAPLVVMVGQQDRRQLAQEPFLAGRLHGLAGEYPVSVDEPVRAQDVPGALVRAYHAAASAAAPPSSSCRWMTGTPRRPKPMRSSAPSACCTPGSGPRGDRGARRVARRRALARARGRRRRRHAGGLGRARGPRRAPRVPGVHGSLRRPRRLPAGPPAVRRPPLPRPRAAARDARRARRDPRRRRADLPPVRLRAGAAGQPGDPPRARHRRRRRGAAQPVAADHPGRAERGLPRPGRWHGAARGPAARAVPQARAARAAGAQRAAARRPRLRRSPSASRPTPSSSRSRRPVGPSSTRASRPAFRWASSARRWAASASPCRARSACGWRCPIVPWSPCSATARVAVRHPGAVERRALPRRALFLVMANGRYAIMDKLAANTGKPAPWPAFDTIDIAAMARAQGCRRSASRTTRTCSPASTRCCRGWRCRTPRSCSRSPSNPDAQARSAGADHAGETAP